MVCSSPISARLASRIAGVLGSLSDLEEFEALASRVRGAFTRRFVTADGRIVGDSIEAYSLALGFGLLEPPVEKLAARVLFELCEGALVPRNASRGSLLEVPLLLDALTRLGRLDLAYRVSLAGPCAEPDAGLSDWLYTTLAGFQLSRDLSERSIAFRRLVIRPRPPLGFGYGDESGEPPLREVEAALVSLPLLPAREHV